MLEIHAGCGIIPNLNHRTAQLTFIIRMVETGRAVSFLPASVGIAHPSLALRPLDPPVMQEVGMAYRPGEIPRNVWIGYPNVSA